MLSARAQVESWPEGWRVVRPDLNLSSQGALGERPYC